MIWHWPGKVDLTNRDLSSDLKKGQRRGWQDILTSATYQVRLVKFHLFPKHKCRTLNLTKKVSLTERLMWWLNIIWSPLEIIINLPFGFPKNNIISLWSPTTSTSTLELPISSCGVWAIWPGPWVVTISIQFNLIYVEVRLGPGPSRCPTLTCLAVRKTMLGPLLKTTPVRL